MTVGQRIFFGAGGYDLGSARGRKLLTHELAHAVQQRETTAQAPLAATTAGDAPEREARAATRAVARGVRPSLTSIGAVRPVVAALGEAETEEAEPETDERGESVRRRAEEIARREGGGRPPQVVPGRGIDWGTGPAPQTAPLFADRDWSMKHPSGPRVTDWDVERLEAPHVTIGEGGAPPDFIVVEPQRVFLTDKGPISASEHSFFAITALRFDASQARTEGEFERVLGDYFPELRTDETGYLLGNTAIGRSGIPGAAFALQQNDPGMKFRFRAFAEGVRTAMDSDPAVADVAIVKFFFSGSQQRKKKPAPAPAPEARPTPSPKDTTPQPSTSGHPDEGSAKNVILRLPSVKARYLGHYRAQVDKQLLVNEWDYERGSPKQAELWDDLLVPGGKKGMRQDQYDYAKDKLSLPKERILRPDWAPNLRKGAMQVDHIVELQVTRKADRAVWNPPDSTNNFELLDQSSNASSGARLSSNIEKERTRLSRLTGEDWSKEGKKDLNFTHVVVEGEGGGGLRWSADDIQAGEHIDIVRGVKKPRDS